MNNRLSIGSLRTMPGFLLLAALMTLGAAPSSAGTVLQLVRDINTDTGGTGLKSQPVVSGSVAYFVGSDVESGDELWKTDGTTAGTVRLADINPGPGSSDPRELTVVGATLYFVATDDTGDAQLWKSDGTAAGTTRAWRQPEAQGSPTDLANAGQLLYFVTANPDNRTLWVSDGTATGTTPVRSFAYAGGVPPVAIGSTLYFIAEDGQTGEELWKSDGTPAGTVRCTDIAPGPSGSGPRQLVAIGETLYFTANDGPAGRDLWKSDCTAAGTTRVTDFDAGPFDGEPGNLTALDGRLYFSAFDAGETYLWSSDGTNSGTFRLKAGVASGLAPVGHSLFFSIRGEGNDYDLWRTDGTAAGTVVVAQIYSGGDFGPRGFTAAGNTLYFVGSDATHGDELWKSDGTGAGTGPVADIAPGSFPALFPLDQKILPFAGAGVLFGAHNGTTGLELWRSDGTAAGTVQVADIHRGTGHGFVDHLVAVGRTLFFTASGSLWASDGTAQGTRKLTAIRWIECSCETQIFIGSGSSLYFYQYGLDRSSELWKSDGTPEGTRLVSVVAPPHAEGEVSVAQFRVAEAGGITYFPRFDGSTTKLWKSDGTSAGTTLVANLSPAIITAAGSRVYFVATTAKAGPELWRSNGTATGTYRVRDLVPGSVGSFPRFLTVVGNRVYFTASDASGDRELWKTDGTAAGTVRMADVFPGVDEHAPGQLTPVGSTLYFTADDGTHGVELWKTNGTPAGTRRVADINPGAPGSDPTSLVAVGGTLYFMANDGFSGRELWKTNGSAAGTVRVADLNPGAGDSELEDMTAMNGALYFVKNFTELWRSDGTAAGTAKAADFGRLNGDDEFPQPILAAIGERLFLGVDSPFYGHELHAVMNDVDNDLFGDPEDNCRYRQNPSQLDQDGDAWGDACDNCQLVPNSSQRNSNAARDPYGNVCDGDLNNDLLTDRVDLKLMRIFFGNRNGDSDLNGDGKVNAADLALLMTLMGRPPGPSGLESQPPTINALSPASR